MSVRVRPWVPKFSRSRLMVRTLKKVILLRIQSAQSNSIQRKRSGFESRLRGQVSKLDDSVESLVR